MTLSILYTNIIKAVQVHKIIDSSELSKGSLTPSRFPERSWKMFQIPIKKKKKKHLQQRLQPSLNKIFRDPALHLRLNTITIGFLHCWQGGSRTVWRASGWGQCWGWGWGWRGRRGLEACRHWGGGGPKRLSGARWGESSSSTGLSTYILQEHRRKTVNLRKCLVILRKACLGFPSRSVRI